MASVNVTGNGPLTFTTSQRGQINIPLTSGYFNADGTLIMSTDLLSTLSGDEKTALEGLV